MDRRCANCTAGLGENFAKKKMICKDCILEVYQCVKCYSACGKTDTCVVHTKRKHICLSKCLNVCIMSVPEAATKKNKKQKIIRKQKPKLFSFKEKS